MINFVCVLKSGGDYRQEHVSYLESMLNRNVSDNHRLIVLTDYAEQEFTFAFPLVYDLPNWWSKLEMFRLTGACIYFDLDTVITGEINGLIESVSGNDEKFIMLKSFKRKRFMSGVMAWNGNYSFILHEFLKERTAGTFKQRTREGGPQAIIDNRAFFGDQDWIEHRLRAHSITITELQRVQPGVCSYKHHLANTKELPDYMNIVCFHGSPRPFELYDGHYLREYYAR